MSDPRLKPLHNDWRIDGIQLKRKWQFANFAQALDAVNAIGNIAEAAAHHPDIEFGWGYLRLRLTTHDEGRLTELDFAVAKAIDQQV